MSTRREHSTEGCLFSAMGYPEKTALKINTFFMNEARQWTRQSRPSQIFRQDKVST